MFITVNVSNLSGAALDWAVAKCEGYSECDWSEMDDDWWPNRYSFNWSHGGPIIERNGIAIGQDHNGQWVAHVKTGVFNGWRFGPAPLIAAMRCYVASKLGDTVEIPDSLIP